MGNNWAVLKERTIQANHRVKLEDLSDTVLQDKDSIMWYVDKNSDYVILSSEPLEQEQYEFVFVSELHNSDDNHVVIIEKVRDQFYDNRFDEGRTVFLLAYEDMLEEEPRTLFLLTEKQALELLPGSKQGGDLREAIKNTPGLLPSL